MTGLLFGDRYQVGDTLGFGGMSEVHRGRDLRLGRDVAVKVLRADLARDPSFQARFRREAQNAASLNHPAIVAVYDTGETPGETGPVPYIVMEFVDGETLRDLLKREGSLAPKRAMEITADVCAALDFSHRHGIVHRDIKPANVMLTKAGAVKVMDFGIARAVADGQSTVTATAAVIGTAQYLSPEQARGEAVDARSDVYATGCVLFELLTGAPPFTGDSPVAVAYQHVREAPRRPSEVKPGLGRELDAIVLKALNKNPLNRYQTAAEMRADLVRALSGQAVQATPLMTEEERTQIMRPGPARVGPVAAAAPLLAPPRRVLPQVWEDEDEPDRSRKVWGFVGIGLLCAALLAGAIFLTLKVTTKPPGAKQVAVPQVQGQTQAAAEAAVVAAGLKVGEVKPIDSPDAQRGTVIRQNPSQDTVVSAGDKVDLQVGRGLTSVAVPNLDGMNAADARAALQKANLGYREVTAVSNDAGKGKVVKQDPATGAQAKPGATVTVTIGSGPTYLVIPADLVGKQFEAASQELKATGLDAVPVPVDGTEAANQVKKLAPPYTAGQKVQAGTVVSLQVSNAQLFVVPNVANLTKDQAVAALRAKGWTGDGATIGATTQDTRLPLQYNNVISQNPAPGKILNKQQSISIVVGRKAQVIVPDIGQGKDYSEAQARCQVAGVQCQGNSTGPVQNQDLANKVISVSPTAGTAIDWDQVVTINHYGEYVPPPPPPTTPKTTPPPVQPPPVQPPATQPPATQPPATQPPATQPPATQPPATQAPPTPPPANPPAATAPTKPGPTAGAGTPPSGG